MTAAQLPARARTKSEFLTFFLALVSQLSALVDSIVDSGSYCPTGLEIGVKSALDLLSLPLLLSTSHAASHLADTTFPLPLLYSGLVDRTRRAQLEKECSHLPGAVPTCEFFFYITARTTR